MEKIVLGLGNNIDYEIVWDSKILEGLIEEYAIKDVEISKDVAIDSERNMIISILGFVKEDVGGERYVEKPDIIEKLAKRFRKKITLGGTSVRAAIVMRKLGYKSALHLVTINDDVRRLIPQDSPYLCSAEKDSCYPHFIVQYRKDTKIKAGDIDLCAARSNRIIYTNDPDNAVMKLDPALPGFLENSKVFLISGFNSMQNIELLKERLEELTAMMKHMPKDVSVFYEDAGFHKPELSNLVRERLLSYIDIYSMNEDELQSYLGRKIDLLDPKQMKKALEDIRKLIPAKTLVLHTQYYALAYGENAKNYEEALRAAILMAGTRFCFGDDFTRDDYNAVTQYALQESGTAFAEYISKLMKDELCCLACIQADERKATTIGLGDSFVGGFLPALL